MCVSDNAMGQHAQTMKKIKHTKEMKDKKCVCTIVTKTALLCNEGTRVVRCHTKVNKTIMHYNRLISQ